MQFWLLEAIIMGLLHHYSTLHIDMNSKTMYKLATGHGQVGDGVLVCAHTHCLYCLFAYYYIGAGSGGGGGGLGGSIGK